MQLTSSYRKYFPADKNLILKEAQWLERTELLMWMVEKVRETYLVQSNPLGLIDDTIEFISSKESLEIDHLYDFYDELASIYRFKFGDNQLEFLFDGSDHLEKYRTDWRTTFEEWIKQFIKKKHFVRAIMDASILFPSIRVAELASGRLRSFLTGQFELKIYRFKGIRTSA